MSLVAVSFYEEPHAVWTLTAVLLLTVLLAWHRVCDIWRDGVT